ncbi:MAG: hypothetical protein IJ443_06205, partial [Firmicutes bacterium]|nr:hypothetical protein [Bacillota bacterium]
MKESLNKLYHRLNALTVFRGVSDQPVICGLEDLLLAMEQLDLDAQLGCYGAFAEAVFEEGGDLSQAIKRIVLEDENFYIVERARGHKPAPVIEEALEAELSLFQQISQLTPADLQAGIDYDGFLASWTVSDVDIAAAYHDQIAGISGTGYGIFAKFNGFTVKDGQLV